jgi:hypothetical protein
MLRQGTRDYNRRNIAIHMKASKIEKQDIEVDSKMPADDSNRPADFS